MNQGADLILELVKSKLEKIKLLHLFHIWPRVKNWYIKEKSLTNTITLKSKPERT